MAGNGWIKLHRQFQEKGYYKKSQYVHLWIHLLLEANHKPKEFMINNEIITINEGQLLTGRRELSRETSIKETTIERVLKLFESEQQIEQRKTTKYRVITILNWGQYQTKSNRVDNKRTADGQQTDTNKNVKNVRIEQEQGEFKKIFNEWYEYKQARRESYKSEQSKKVFENKLLRLSGNNIETAKLIIEQSIANNWAGIFELKNNNNGSIRKTEQRNFAGNTTEKWDEIFNHRGTDGSEESPVSLLSLEK